MGVEKAQKGPEVTRQKSADRFLKLGQIAEIATSTINESVKRKVPTMLT